MAQVCHREANVDAVRVKTCGSVGKLTASRKSADLDLVVYVNGLLSSDKLASIPGMKDKFPAILVPEHCCSASWTNPMEFWTNGHFANRFRTWYVLCYNDGPK